MIKLKKISESMPNIKAPVILGGFQPDHSITISSGRWDGKKFILDNPNMSSEEVEFWADYEVPEQEMKIVRKVQYFDHEYDGSN